MEDTNTKHLKTLKKILRGNLLVQYDPKNSSDPANIVSFSSIFEPKLEDIIAISVVCKKLKNLSIKYQNNTYLAEFIHQDVLTQLTKLSDINISLVLAFFDFKCQDIFNKCFQLDLLTICKIKNLTSLNLFVKLTPIINLSTEHIRQLTKAAPLLEQLKISNFGFDDSQGIKEISKFKFLKKLEFKMIRNFKEKALYNIMKFLPQLQHLGLDLQKLQNQLIFKNYLKLKNQQENPLQFANNVQTDETDSNFQGDNFCNIIFQILSSLLNLKSIYLERVNFCPQQLAWIGNKYSRIKLQMCQIDDEKLNFLVGNKNFIQEIELRSNKNLTIRSIRFLVENQVNLLVLNLDDCRQIRDQSLKIICQKLKYLRELSVQSCKLTYKGIVYVRRIDSLVVLNIMGNMLRSIQILGLLLNGKCLRLLRVYMILKTPEVQQNSSQLAQGVIKYRNHYV